MSSLLLDSDPTLEAVSQLKMLTTYDVADILVVPHLVVLRLIRSGKLKPTKSFDKSTHRFSRSYLQSWIESNGEVVSNE